MYFKQVLRRRSFQFLLLLILILSIKIFATNSSWVENYYTSGFFPRFSNFYRILTGWLPFSVGDIFYSIAGIWLIYKIVIFLKKLFKKKYQPGDLRHAMVKVVVIAMVIYIVFNIFWGLNYNRKGIAYQLGLPTIKYDSIDVRNLQQLLLQKVNQCKQVLINKNESYPTNKELYSRAYNCYRQIEQTYPFMKYNSPSVKSSMYGWLGNYFGFTGYYNPFSGEAQVNTTVPKFILPYTTCHEIAHQLGYAKEDEANFAGYLSATFSTDTLFHYSAYLDLFMYANTELFFIDSNLARQGIKQLIPPVQADIKEWRNFYINHRSPLEPLINWAYGKYLKANQQPQGMQTYDEVIGDLISFYKKYGRI